MQDLQKLKVIIIGAGEVGAQVAERFSEFNKVEVTLIERDPERSAYVKSHINCLHITGSALEPRILKKAGILTCDLFYAVTDSDEVNLLACQLAQEMIKRKLANLLGTASHSLDESNLQLETNSNPKARELDADIETPCAPLGESQEPAGSFLSVQ